MKNIVKQENGANHVIMTAIVLNPLFATPQLVIVCVRLESKAEYVSEHAVMANLE